MKKLFLLSFLLLISTTSLYSKSIVRNEKNIIIHNNINSKNIETEVFFALSDKEAVKIAKKLIRHRMALYYVKGVQPAYVSVVRETKERYKITYVL